MSDTINFNNNNQYFKDLVKEARNLSAGGLTNAELKTLESIANKDGTVTHDEKLFLEALKNNANVKKLNSGGSNGTLNLDIDTPDFARAESYKPDGYGWDHHGGKNPYNAKITDIGKGKIDPEMVASNKKNTNVLKLEIFKELNIHNKAEFTPLINNFLAKNPTLAEDKEALVYLKHLISSERQPPISSVDLKKCFAGLTDLMKKDLDWRAGNNRNLAVSALHDIALPSNIDQKKIGTCSGTCVQIQLAIRTPAEYINMLSCLGSNQNYHTISGQEIKPNWTFVNEKKGVSYFISNKVFKNLIKEKLDEKIIKSLEPLLDEDYTKEEFVKKLEPLNLSNEQKKLIQKEAKGDFDTFRSISCKIIQNAFLDFADGYGEEDRQYDSSIRDDGLEDLEIKRLIEPVFGKQYALASKVENYTSEQLIQILIAAKPSAANPVLVGIDYSSAGETGSLHSVNVVNVDTKANTVKIINPWGREEVFPVETLKNRIDSVISPVNTPKTINK